MLTYNLISWLLAFIIFSRDVQLNPGPCDIINPIILNTTSVKPVNRHKLIEFQKHRRIETSKSSLPYSDMARR